MRVFPFAHYRKYRQIVVMVSPSALQLGHAPLRVMESRLPTAPAMLSKHPPPCPCFRAPATITTNCQHRHREQQGQLRAIQLLTMLPNSQYSLLLHFRLRHRNGSLCLQCKKKQQPLLPSANPLFFPLKRRSWLLLGKVRYI